MKPKGDNYLSMALHQAMRKMKPYRHQPQNFLKKGNRKLGFMAYIFHITGKNGSLLSVNYIRENCHRFLDFPYYSEIQLRSVIVTN